MIKGGVRYFTTMICHDSDIRGKLDDIRQVLPEKIHCVKRHEEDCENVTLEINEQWIFRFSKDVKTQENLEKEKRLLPQLAGILPVSTPNIEYSGTHFIGYRKLEGHALTKNLLLRLDNHTRMGLARELGDFLRVLHHVSYHSGFVSEKPLDRVDFWQDVWPVVSMKLSGKATKNARDYFKREKHFRYERKLIHGDFKGKHILVNRGRITGIIDFGCTTFSDPARDFGRLAEKLGKRFMREMLIYYANSCFDTQLGDRAEFHRRRGLFYIVFSKNDGNSLHKILEEIECLFR